jgi:hypothetical protein
MEEMRPRHSQSSRGGLACLSALFALLVQLAPTLHALTPHDEQPPDCKHGQMRVHFEASNGGSSSPCIVCAQLLQRQTVLSLVGIQITDALTITSTIPSIEIIPVSSILELPPSRGPPLTL